MLALPFADASLGGAVAFYAIVHTPTSELPMLFHETARVMRRGGLALVAFHVGEEMKHVEELFGVETSLDFVFHPVRAVEDALRAADLDIRATLVREPYEGAEHPSQRAYVLAMKR